MNEMRVAMAVTRNIQTRKFISLKKAGQHDEGRYSVTPWEVPGGKIEEGESVEEAASRELREETGIDASIEKAFGKGLSYSFQQKQGIVEVEFRPVLLETREEEVDLSAEHADFRWLESQELEDNLTEHEIEAFRRLGVIE